MPDSGPCCIDIRASRRARAKRDVDVKVFRVVVNPVGVPDRVCRMKPFAELPMIFCVVDYKTRSGLIPASTSLSRSSRDIEKTRRR
jgi:hypothetical protein